MKTFDTDSYQLCVCLWFVWSEGMCVCVCVCVEGCTGVCVFIVGGFQKEHLVPRGLGSQHTPAQLSGKGLHLGTHTHTHKHMYTHTFTHPPTHSSEHMKHPGLFLHAAWPYATVLCIILQSGPGFMTVIIIPLL